MKRLIHIRSLLIEFVSDPTDKHDELPELHHFIAAGPDRIHDEQDTFVKAHSNHTFRNSLQIHFVNIAFCLWQSDKLFLAVALYDGIRSAIYLFNHAEVAFQDSVDLNIVEVVLAEIPSISLSTIRIHILVQHHLDSVDCRFHLMSLLLVFDIGETHQDFDELVAVEVAFRGGK